MPILLIHSEALDIPTTELQVYGEEWMTLLKTAKEPVMKRMLMEGTQNIEARNLQDHLMILHKICVHNLAPRGGTYEKVTTTYLIIIYHLAKRKCLNLPYIIQRHMIGAIAGMRATSTIPYGIVLTMIFHFEGILLEEYESID